VYGLHDAVPIADGDGDSDAPSDRGLLSSARMVVTLFLRVHDVAEFGCDDVTEIRAPFASSSNSVIRTARCFLNTGWPSPVAGSDYFGYLNFWE
jgi:hypothetical protein